jgi:hypothetical protein
LQRLAQSLGYKMVTENISITVIQQLGGRPLSRLTVCLTQTSPY